VKRVLVVDDHTENLYFLQALLGSQGLEVLTASNGAQALEMARKAPPHLVVSDILMPVMDGYTLCREWMADIGLCHIPFIFYTATYTDARDRQLGYELGAEAYLTKPSEPEDFLAAVLPILARDPQPGAGCRPSTPPESTLTRYSEALVRRLEDKMAELEEANRRLKEEIAERERVESALLASAEQLRQAQKMEAIGTLAGGIAHDFNNILSAIVGYTEMARSRVPPDSSALRNLDQVLKASHRATDLVKQILAFSRQREQERRPLQIAPIIKEGLRLLRSSLPTTIEIRHNLAGDRESAAVLADPTQIHQVLINLCTNAAHAMRTTGGVLEVTVTEAEIPDSAAPTRVEGAPVPYVKLTVSDTGHGMEAAVKERIFEPYFTTKQVGEGTGLGLAVVQGIVRSHRGMIKVESEPGRGTTFEVLLPRIEREPPQHPAAPEQLLTGSERILFVDDEEIMTDLGREMLEPLGYQVTTKTSSSDAFETFQTQPDAFDLVITDMTMPGMTGVDLSREILKIKPNIPIILCTGYSELITEEKAKAIGIQGFALKPLNFRSITELICQVLNHVGSSLAT